MSDQNPQPINIKINDEELKGRYANLVRISHNKEEFILDFINFVPPQGIVSARMILSPGHAKRLIRALQTNVVAYEEAFGGIQEAEGPASPDSPIH